MYVCIVVCGNDLLVIWGKMGLDRRGMCVCMYVCICVCMYVCMYSSLRQGSACYMGQDRA